MKYFQYFYLICFLNMFFFIHKSSKNSSPFMSICTKCKHNNCVHTYCCFPICYSYTPVYELVSSFLNKADIQDDKAAAIMRLGATEEFIHHFQVSGYTHTHTIVSAENFTLKQKSDLTSLLQVIVVFSSELFVIISSAVVFDSSRLQLRE